jgi:hypothetical protein
MIREDIHEKEYISTQMSSITTTHQKSQPFHCRKGELTSASIYSNKKSAIERNVCQYRKNIEPQPNIDLTILHPI